MDHFVRGLAPITAAKKACFLDGLVQMVALDFQPFSVVEDAGFKAFVRAIDSRLLEAIPTRKTLRAAVHERASAARTALRTELASLNTSFCLVVDGWSSPAMDSYSAMNVHFIDDSWALQTRSLGATLSFRHDSASLAEIMNSQLREFSISASAVSGFVSDTAHNITAALRLFPAPAFPCLAHVVQLAIRAAVSRTPPLPAIIVDLKSVVAHFKRSSKAKHELILEEAERNVRPIGVKAANDTRWNSLFLMIGRLVMLKIPLLAWASSTECEAAEIVRKIPWKILETVHDILSPFDEFTEMLEGEKHPTLSMVLPLLDCLLSSLGESTGSHGQPEMAGCPFPSTSDPSAALAALESHEVILDAERPSDANPLAEPQASRHVGILDVPAGLRRELLGELEFRLNAVLAARGEAYIVAQALDPRWKCGRFPKDFVGRVLRSHCSACDVEGHPHGNDPIVDITDSGAGPSGECGNPRKHRRFLEWVRRANAESSSSTETSSNADRKRLELELETERLLSLPREGLHVDPLAWWRKHEKEFPLLSRLARKYLAIPATSASVERLFSTAGYFAGNRRSKLQPAILDDLLVLRSWLTKEAH
jgi:hypothetical protein